VRLNPRQLPAQLRSGLAPLYLLSGDEPLLVDEALHAIRRAARQAGYVASDKHVAERGFDWAALRGSLDNLSLFATSQLVELRLPTGKPGDAGAKQLVALAADPPPEKVLIVITPALTGSAAKAKWVRSLVDAGVWVPLRAPDASELPGWLNARLRAAGLECDPAAAEMLAERIEGNLLAAKQEIDKLVLLAAGKPVTVERIRASVADGARYDVFQLADAALAGDGARAARILRHLEQEGVAPTLVLWSLVRELTVLHSVVHSARQGDSWSRALAAAGVWRSREPLVGRAAQRVGAAGARRLLQQAAVADRIVKGARRGLPWNALMELTLALAGVSELRAETA
jgi:DNA polymerase-3 subunit delta